MRRACLALVLLLMGVPAWGATYYVDATGGNDNNTGIATNQAWKTISKVNAFSFSAGDSILFKRGETWWETLIIPSSGNAGNPIIFGAYGTGNLPSLNGSNARRGINSFNKIYITIKDMMITNCTPQGILNMGGHHWTVDGVTLSYNYREGIKNWGTDSTNNINNLTVQNSTSMYNGGEGIYAGNYGNQGKIHNNIVHHNCNNMNFETNGGIKIYGPGILSNYTITNNIAYNNGTNPYKPAAGAGIWVDNTAGGHTISYNKVFNNAFLGIFLEKEPYSDIVAYNIVYNESSTTQAYSGSGIMVSDNSNNHKIFNNTIYNCRIGIAIFGTWPLAPNTSSNNMIKNNLVYGSTFRALSAWGGGENDVRYGSGNVYEYNSFGPETLNFIEWGAGTFKSTYREWESAYGGPTHSIQADPFMTNPSGGMFNLQSTSPAIDAGTDVSLNTDSAGNRVPAGFAPDIGAIEYYGEPRVPSPPGGLSITPY